MTIRLRLGVLCARLAQAITRFGVWISGTGVELPSDDEYQRFDAWSSRHGDGGRS